MGSWKKVSVGRSVILRPIKTFFGFFFSVFFSSSEKSSFFLANFVQNGIAPSLHLRVCLRHDAGRQRWSNWRFPLETVRRFSARRLSPRRRSSKEVILPRNLRLGLSQQRTGRSCLCLQGLVQER